MTRSLAASLLVAALAPASAVGCKAKANDAECEALIDRYAQLVVTEKFPDAAAEAILAERDREKKEARADDTLKNCSSEVSRAELECAMRATTTDAFERCLQ